MPGMRNTGCDKTRHCVHGSDTPVSCLTKSLNSRQIRHCLYKGRLHSSLAYNLA